MQKFKVGDIVKIKDTRQQYTHYESWAELAKATNFAYTEHLKINQPYIIKHIMKHTEDDRQLALLESLENGKQYIYGLNASGDIEIDNITKVFNELKEEVTK